MQKSITNQIIAEENEDSDVSNTGEVKKLNGNVCVGAEENHINGTLHPKNAEHSFINESMPN